MGQARTTKRGGSPPVRHNNKRLRQGILALAVVALVAAAFLLRRQGDDATTAGMGLLTGGGALRDRLVLPASPKRPRPVTLDPAQFTDPEVRQAYQAAKDTPEPIENMPCYCGCFGSAGHRNNLDCFHDNHGVT